MPYGEIGPGDDVEAWCTRCRMNLNHRVIAIAGGNIQRVQCLTCGGDHKYYPPKTDKTKNTDKKPVRVAAADKSLRSASRSAVERAEGEWTAFMKDAPEDLDTRPYKVTEGYRTGEFLQHPLFGKGRVLDIVGAEKMQVIFQEGRKVLICNKKLM